MLKKESYLKMLSAISKLSGLFSESSIPFINYRAVENIYCKTFGADNLSRSDIAYDAKIDNLGIGIKTFTCTSNYSSEKIAEFNSLSSEFVNAEGEELVNKLATYRNDRILLANRLYNIEKSKYHIVARREKQLIIFDTDYSLINIDKIHGVEKTRSGIRFKDDLNEYSFNRSKSTLYRKFKIAEDAIFKDVELLKDPFEVLVKLYEDEYELANESRLIPGVNYVILPLYGYKSGHEKAVFSKSGLNQWNAEGRERNINEVYIPVPAKIHQKYPDFFPPIIKGEKKHFKLHLPNGETHEASMCQTAKLIINGQAINKGKGLMTKSNKGLGDWLLRKALQLDNRILVTYKMLEKIGYDSVIVYKHDSDNYSIDIKKINSFEEFIENELDVI